MGRKLPLRASYAFARDHGLGDEADQIATTTIAWESAYTSSVRAAYMVELLEAPGILADFIAQHWPAASDLKLRWYKDLKRRFERSRDSGGAPSLGDDQVPAKVIDHRTTSRRPSRQAEKSFTGMAGEFLVAGELNRRHILAAVTYGASKSADVWAFAESPSRAVRIEVKTTTEQRRAWIVGAKALERQRQDLFWVLVLLPLPGSIADTDAQKRGQHAPRFYVLTTEELGKLASDLHERYKKRFREKNRREFDRLGVVKVRIADAVSFENDWGKIEQWLK